VKGKYAEIIILKSLLLQTKERSILFGTSADRSDEVLARYMSEYAKSPKTSRLS
jgi:hypothetical protein